MPDKLENATEIRNRDYISDEQFVSQLNYLKRLKKFVITEGIALEPPQRAALNINSLSVLKYKSNGRIPILEEWEMLDDKTVILSTCLNETLRKKFQLRESLISLSFTMIAIAAVLLVITILSNIVFQPIGQGSLAPSDASIPQFSFFVVYLFVLGALGSAAFVLVNALGIHVDPLVDVGNQYLMIARVMLGALFALILTFPFGYQSFLQFMLSVQTSSARPDLKSALFLLAPFVLGFSTSLVLTILNRLVESIQTFFGASTKP